MLVQRGAGIDIQDKVPNNIYAEVAVEPKFTVIYYYGVRWLNGTDVVWPRRGYRHNEDAY